MNKRSTILVSFWSIFAPGVAIEAVARAIVAGKTLSQALGANAVDAAFVAASIKQLSHVHHVHIMIDPPVVQISIGEFVAYLTSFGLGPEKVWVDTASNLLAEPYDFVVDCGEGTCYHTVVVVGEGEDIERCVAAHIEAEELRMLRRAFVSRSQALPLSPLGQQVALDMAF